MRYEFYVLNGSQPEGPLSFAELQYLWESRDLTPESLYRREGSEEWLPLKGLAESLALPLSPSAEESKISIAARTAKPLFSMVGVGELLNVFDQWLSISVTAVPGFTSRSKGSGKITFDSIEAITLVDAGAEESGCLLFSFRNRPLNRVSPEVKSDHRFLFVGTDKNLLARRILKYVEEAVNTSLAVDNELLETQREQQVEDANRLRRATRAAITNYKTVIAKGPDELDRLVNSAIREGWEPYGGALIADGNFLQTIVSYDGRS